MYNRTHHTHIHIHIHIHIYIFITSEKLFVVVNNSKYLHKFIIKGRSLTASNDLKRRVKSQPVVSSLINSQLMMMMLEHVHTQISITPAGTDLTRVSSRCRWVELQFTHYNSHIIIN